MLFIFGKFGNMYNFISLVFFYLRISKIYAIFWLLFSIQILGVESNYLSILTILIGY